MVAAAVVFALVHSGGGAHPVAAPDTGTNPIAPEQPSGANRPDHFGTPIASGRVTVPGSTGAPEGAHGGHSIGDTTPAPASISPVRTIECSSPSGCRVAVSLPPAFVQALRERFPTVQVVSSTTILTDVDVPAETVVNRMVIATAGALRLRVSLHQANDHDDPRRGVDTQGRQRVVYATTLRDGLAVAVTVTGTPGRVPGTATVAGLAGDARLAVAT